MESLRSHEGFLEMLKHPSTAEDLLLYQAASHSSPLAVGHSVLFAEIQAALHFRQVDATRLPRRGDRDTQRGPS